MLMSLRQATPHTCGGKAGVLGALLRAGLPVPDGFVVTLDAYRRFHREAATGLPPKLREAIGARLQSAGTPFAVRSSASDEDGSDASGAGQYTSVLAVSGAVDVAAAVHTCWESLHSDRATHYRTADRTAAAGTADGPGPPEPAMAVLIQRLVDADASGILFTATDQQAQPHIEASWGLGPGVVSGRITPDSYLLAPDGTIFPSIVDKPTRLDREGTRLVERAVPDTDRQRPVLDDDTVRQLGRLGETIADLLGGPQDIEWAIVDRQIWIVQARPLTAPVPVASSAREAPGSLLGSPGSHGTATGTARILHGPDDFGRLQAGDILVCAYTDPGWTPLFAIAAGVVTERGGVLSHAAIVARERGIPAVLGVPDAIAGIADGTIITIDGGAGTVTPKPL